ncbi:2-methoxy-6-polyprenyl-1,4-benzoquinol methylase, mitochondrial [subsurface metagenome]
MSSQFLRLFGLYLLGLTIVSCNPVPEKGRWSKEWEEWFETIQPSDVIMDTIGVQPGMTIAEVGAGNGRLAVKIAKQVGIEGKVYANDIDPAAIRFMRKRIRREKISNMVVIRGKVDDPLLPPGEIDIVYVVNTYSHFDKPVDLLKNMIPAFKPGGRLVIIEYDPVKAPEAGSHSTSKETVLDEAEKAGYYLTGLKTFLPKDNIYIFQPAGGEK